MADDQEKQAELAGLWRVTSDELGTFDIKVERGRGRIVRLGPGFMIGNPEVLNGGDLFFARLLRIDGQKFDARVAKVEVEDSPTYPKSWPTSVSYVDTILEWNDSSSRWTIDDPEIELSKPSDTSQQKALPAGACEKKFENDDDATIYACEYPQDPDGCSSAGEKAFWPSTNCKNLGYEYKSSELLEYWQKSATNNVTPGAQGKWGDGTGGEKLVSAAALAAGDASDDEDDPTPSDDGKGGASCLQGTWRTDTCNGAKTHTLSFTTGNTGHYVMPDCNGYCTKPLDYHYDYSVSGSNVTLRYTGSSEIVCGGETMTPPKPTSNDTFTFTCSGGTLTTTSSAGSKTYTRVN